MVDSARDLDAAPVPQIPEPPLVYFDQSVWSMWIADRYPREITDELVKLAQDRRFGMVVSIWHIVETVKLSSAAPTPKEAQLKGEHAQFIGRMPNLVGLRHTQDLLVQEVARAYSAFLGGDLVVDPPPFIAAGDVERTIHQALAVDAGYVPRAADEVRSGGRGSMGWWSWLDNEKHGVDRLRHRAARADRDATQRPRTWLTRLRERAALNVIANPLLRIADQLKPRVFALSLITCREETADYLGFAPAIVDFARWLWACDFRGSPALVYRVAYEAVLDPTDQRQPQVNDGRDIEHAFAAPFVDILVHEGGHVEFARQAVKKAALPCKILNGRPKTRDLEKLVSLIEAWPC